MNRAILISALFLLIAVGCVSPIKYISEKDSTYRLLEPAQLRGGLSKELVLIADNQLHSLKGEQSWLQQGFSDKLVTHVAIRPPLLDYYSSQLLRYALRKNKNKLVVHLGDAADISCANEFEEFLEIMDGETHGNWLMVPGNHDSQYFGNYDKNNKCEWSADCDATLENQSGYMNKRRFLELYLDARLEKGFKEKKDGGGYEGMGVIQTHMAAATVYWRKEPEEKKDDWDSYLLQIIDISEQNTENKVWMILLDTTNYDNDPHLFWKPAGTVGKVGSGQWQKVVNFINQKNNSNEKSKKENIFILAGHSPLNELDRESKRKITDLKRSNILIYLSAHTHQGNWYVHQSKHNNDQLLELNIGSITDSRLVDDKPVGPSYRTFQILSSENGPAVRSKLFRIDDKELKCSCSWRYGDRFYSYKPELFNFKKTKIGLLKILVAFHWEEIKNGMRLSRNGLISREIENGTKESDIKALIEKLEFIETNTNLNEEHISDELRYKACQAFWASQEEKYEALGIKKDLNKIAAFDEDVTAISLTKSK